MTSVWTDVVPSTMKREACERYPVYKLGGAPPLRFVPEVSEKHDGEEKATVTLKVSEVAKDTYQKFLGGTAEEAVRHVKRFYALEVKLGYRKTHRELRHTRKEQQDIVDAIAEDTIDSDELDKRSGAVEYVKELDVQIKDAKNEFWSLWERLLGQDLLPKWHEIVVIQCDTTGYIDTDGIRVDGAKRGRRFASMRACLRGWLLLKMESNAAERHQQYLDGQVIMPKNGLSVTAFCDRMVELNKLTKFLPTQKDEEGAPRALERGNVPFSDMKLCSIIVKALPFAFQTEYWAHKDQGFHPTDLTELRHDLKRLEPAFRQTSTLLDKVNSSIPRKPSAGGNGKDDENGKKRERSPKHKSSAGKESPKSANRPSKKGKVDRHCEKCAKKSPRFANTHDTAKCRLWTDSLEPASKKASYINTHTHLGESGDQGAVSMFAQLQLENKKLNKKLSKMSKKGKKKSKKAQLKKLLADSDSEDSSDSDSD